jgi:hypothetical protein
VHPMASVLPHDTHTPPMGYHDHVRKPSVDAAAWIPNACADRCSSLSAPFSARNIQVCRHPSPRHREGCMYSYHVLIHISADVHACPPLLIQPRPWDITSASLASTQLRGSPTCAHADWSPRFVLHTQCTLYAAIRHPRPRHRERYDRRTAAAHAHACLGDPDVQSVICYA